VRVTNKLMAATPPSRIQERSGLAKFKHADAEYASSYSCHCLKGRFWSTFTQMPYHYNRQGGADSKQNEL
jgi:hypothetical protein